MAYQNIGTPRFYIDQMQYMKSCGVNFEKYYEDNGYSYTGEDLYKGLGHGYWRNIFTDPSLFDFSHQAAKHIRHASGIGHDPSNGDKDYMIWDIPTGFSKFEHVNSDNMGLYVAYLNHDIGNRDNMGFFTSIRGVLQPNISPSKDYILGSARRNGTTVYLLDEDIPDGYDFIRVGFGATSGNDGTCTEIYLGGISTGTYYDMSISPDLNLSMEIQYDDINHIETITGKTITQGSNSGQIPWHLSSNADPDKKIEPWAIQDNIEEPYYYSEVRGGRAGRRIWNLSFSYMSDKDLFSSNYGSNTYGEQGSFTEIGYDGGDVDTLNLGTELLTTTNLGSLTNGAMSAGTTEAGWTHHASYDYDSVTRVDAGVTIVSDGTPDSDTDRFQSFHSNAFSITEGAQYRVEYNVTVNSGHIGYAVVIKDPVGYSAGYNSGNLSTGTHSISEIFTATSTDTSAHLEFYTSGYSTTNATIHNASVRSVNSTDFYYDIDNDNSFSAQVLNKISHGEKFIFQPNNTANNPSDFAICVLDNDSFSMERVAPNIYNIKMRIMETL